MSFASNVQNRRKPLISLLVAKDHTNKMAWYFIDVNPIKLRKFEVDMRTTGGELKQYGKILESGYGDSPPQHIMEKMKKLGFQ